MSDREFNDTPEECLVVSHHSLSTPSTSLIMLPCPHLPRHPEFALGHGHHAVLSPLIQRTTTRLYRDQSFRLKSFSFRQVAQGTQPPKEGKSELSNRSLIVRFQGCRVEEEYASRKFLGAIRQVSCEASRSEPKTSKSGNKVCSIPTRRKPDDGSSKLPWLDSLSARVRRL